MVRQGDVRRHDGDLEVQPAFPRQYHLVTLADLAFASPDKDCNNNIPLASVKDNPMDNNSADVASSSAVEDHSSSSVDGLSHGLIMPDNPSADYDPWASCPMGALSSDPPEDVAPSAADRVGVGGRSKPPIVLASDVADVASLSADEHFKLLLASSFMMKSDVADVASSMGGTVLESHPHSRTSYGEPPVAEPPAPADAAAEPPATATQEKLLSRVDQEWLQEWDAEWIKLDESTERAALAEGKTYCDKMSEFKLVTNVK